MRFFERIFGKITAPKARALQFDEIESFLQQTSALQSKKLEKGIFSKISEIKYLLSEVTKRVESLKEKEVSLQFGNTRLRKAVKTSKESLVTQLNALIKKLEPPKTVELEQLMDYSFSSTKLLSESIISARKNIFYSQTLLAQEIREIGKTLIELETAFIQLKNIFEQSKLQEFESIKKCVEKLREQISEKKLFQEHLNKKSSKEKQLKKSKMQILGQLKVLKNSAEMIELLKSEKEKNELLKKKHELKGRIISIIGKVEKPVHRFMQLVDSKHYVISEQEKELLYLYFQDPFFAIKKDPKGITLKKMLIEVEKLLLDSTIALKEKEKPKKLETLRELIEFDFFSEIFWNLNLLDSQINSLDKKIDNFHLTKKISGLEQQTMVLEREISENEAEAKNISLKITEKENQILSIKESLEKDALKHFGQEITVKLDGN